VGVQAVEDSNESVRLRLTVKQDQASNSIAVEEKARNRVTA
jgi:hypothetical protein